MSTAAKRYCSGSPTCPNLQGQCVRHGTSAQRRDKARGSAQERGYDSQWAKFSEIFRAQHPVCGERIDGQLHQEHSVCLREGRTQAAEVVDHIIPMSQGGGKYDPLNLQSLCRRCNTAKANTVERSGGNNALSV